MKETYANLSKDSRKAVREFAKFYQEPFSPLMGWLLKNAKDEYYTRYEAQGQTELITDDKIIATCGDAYKAHGQGSSNLKFWDIVHCLIDNPDRLEDLEIMYRM